MLARRCCIFYATRAQAHEAAEEWPGLSHQIASEWDEAGPGHCTRRDLDTWWDRQIMGGGCRVVWGHGIAWISRHSGYPQADVTAEVVDIFRFLGCENVEERARHRNPYIYS